MKICKGQVARTKSVKRTWWKLKWRNGARGGEELCEPMVLEVERKVGPSVTC